ncbi:MAG TPA: nickel-dependent hydrogenase large subunit, partial [Saprospiraceae bacterium]|nr:nickel-dependent hydrogenase large subunit [Saprospiraceae bacterium]
VEQVYIPDLLAVAPYYLDWGGIGGGLGNFMAYGDMPTNGYNDRNNLKFPSGVILNSDLSKIHEVDPTDDAEIREFIERSWYEYSVGDKEGLHPWKGETDIKYTGPKPPYDYLDVEKKYS